MTSYSGIQMFMEKLNQLINCSDNPLIDIPSIVTARPELQLLYQELGSIIQTLYIEEHQHIHGLDDMKKRFTYAADEAEYIVDIFLSDAHNKHLTTCKVSNPFPNHNHDIDARRSSKSLVDLFLSCVNIRDNHKNRPTSKDSNPSLNQVNIRNKHKNRPTSKDPNPSLNQNHVDDWRSFTSLNDLLLSCVHSRNNEHLPVPNPSLNLDVVMRSFESIKVDSMSVTVKNMKSDSSPVESAAGISNTRNSKKLLDEMIVGFNGDAELIRDKLVEDQKKLDVVSIVGMGGIGKTTLATKVFNDRYVKHHFHVRVWVTVSQTYDKRAVLIQILESIRTQLDLEKDTDSGLREMVHKQLMGRRYLIVIDDIWHIQTWDEVKLFLPHDNTGSRILLTSRIAEVAKHANSDGFIHHLGFLNKENGWGLLCKKAFHGNEFPEWSLEPGMQIVENCKGLPLSLVVIAGILAKEAWSKESWVEIAKVSGSYIVGDQNGCLETLALSYNHLPRHLRECFLYLSGFPEDYKFQVRRLIWLWVAEGFIQQAGNKSLEDIAESYLLDLIDRNLVIVSHRRMYDGAVRACTLHDLVRELCLIKFNEEGFFLKTERLMLSSNVITPPHKTVRMFLSTYKNIPGPSAQNLRSLTVLSRDSRPLTYEIAKYFHTFKLLRVLNLQNCDLNCIPKSMELLVHLRYLAICKPSAGFPSTICKLWGLQTLTYITDQIEIKLPRNISDLVNLRHLWSHLRSGVGPSNYKVPFYLCDIEKPMNLQSISNVELGDGVGNLQKCFPYIKELTYETNRDEECDLKSLTCLENLTLTFHRRRGWNFITFPETLKSLTLRKCCLSWSEMSMMQSLPNLQVLKLKSGAFDGSCWNTNGQVFQQLKFLKLDELSIQQWEACTASFPYLIQLEIVRCHELEGIPLEIGDIPTLQLIRIKWCNESVEESVRRIEEEQNDLGNYDLKIEFREYWSESY